MLTNVMAQVAGLLQLHNGPNDFIDLGTERLKQPLFGFGCNFIDLVTLIFGHFSSTVFVTIIGLAKLLSVLLRITGLFGAYWFFSGGSIDLVLRRHHRYIRDLNLVILVIEQSLRTVGVDPKSASSRIRDQRNPVAQRPVTLVIEKLVVVQVDGDGSTSNVHIHTANRVIAFSLDPMNAEADATQLCKRFQN